ncbi:MAG TPA: glycosyltransferase [Elusimicrobiales bacterium]|nr:glycosyltransferase [Elusimicrobiales bacterium]
MKNVLVIANLNHAAPRMPGIMAHLPSGNWRAHIVTPQFPEHAPGITPRFQLDCPVLSAPYAGDALMFWRKLLLRHAGFKPGASMTEQLGEALPSGFNGFAGALVRWYQALFTYPDAESTWIEPAASAVLAASQKIQFSAVISSSPYCSSHYAALTVKERLNLPWIADLRDLWTQNHNYPFFAPRRALDAFLERRLLRKADAVVTVSPGLADAQAAFLGREVLAITNGYEPSQETDRHVDQKFSIVYTGPIYEGKQDPEIIMAALRSLLDKNQVGVHKISLEFYGQPREFITALIRKYRLEQVVFQCGRVPHAVALEKQRTAQMLLFLQWGEQRKGIYTTKLFEYLAARRPILATGPYSSDGPADIIKSTQSGYLARNPQETESLLLELYNAFKTQGKVHYAGLTERMRAYEYPQLALDYARLLDKVSGGK